MEDKRLGAVVLFIDSPGGSATASEAMTSALDELAKKVPLVVFMNNVAGSGGYYVATPAKWIVAQPGTITGSIGVINAKATTQGLFEKLRTNRIPLYRGANADFGSSLQPLTEAESEAMRKSIQRVYEQFTERVARSRNLSRDAVDAIGGGRVWTGTQALENGLVDQLGDLRTALEKARELAGLPDYAPLVVYQSGKKDNLAPRLAESLNPAAVMLRYLYDGMQVVYNGRAQMLMPVHVE
jgi:protease-4